MKARQLLKQILLWLGMMLDFGDWIVSMDQNPLVTPVHQGPHKTRHLPERFKEGVARSAAGGDGSHSGRHLLHMMQKFGIATGVAETTGNTWDWKSLSRYFACCQSWFRSVPDPIFSIAMDGTTLSGKSFLFSTMYSCGKACWCPPMVTH